jgi:hypothetical protein
VWSNMRKGRDEHIWWSAHRSEFPIVSTISDAVGRADWPNERIWDQPHQVYLSARDLLSNGKLMEAGKFALLAAYQTQWCAQAVGDYIDATLSGASRVKSILEVAVVVGQVAESILAIWFVGQGVFRLLTRKSATLALEGGAQRQLPAGGQTAPTSISPPAAPPPPKPMTRTVSIHSEPPAVASPKAVRKEIHASMSQVREQLGMPAVTQPGRLALAQEAQFERHLKEYMDYVQSEFKALKARNPNWTLKDAQAVVDRADARYGGWLPND